MLPPAGLPIQYHTAKGPPGTTPELVAQAAVILEASSLTGVTLLVHATGRVLEEVEFSSAPAAGKWTLLPNFKEKDWDGAAYNSAAAQRKAAKDAARAAIPEPGDRKPKTIRNR